MLKVVELYALSKTYARREEIYSQEIHTLGKHCAHNRWKCLIVVFGCTFQFHQILLSVNQLEPAVLSE